MIESLRIERPDVVQQTVTILTEKARAARDSRESRHERSLRRSRQNDCPVISAIPQRTSKPPPPEQAEFAMP